tara:strand:+ start:86 stop:1180 length:1095 start_codon:yes stop_codon:yes gene_type:complete
MINDQNNEIFYFIKVTDEILRYKKIRNFFFNKQSFLQFEKMNYNLNENEIILLEDLLVNKYFQDIKPLVKSSYIKSNRTYDISKPDNSITYSNIFTLSNEKDITKLTNCLLPEGVSKEKEGAHIMNHPGQKWRELGLGRWNNQNIDFEYFLIKWNNMCVWEYMCLMIKDYTGTEITSEELVGVLVKKYKELEKKSNMMKIIKEILKKEGKSEKSDRLVQGLDLAEFITLDNYWLTLLDIFLIVSIYEIPLIIFSSAYILPWQKREDLPSVVFGPNNSPVYYIMKVGKAKKNQMPYYGIIKYKNKMKIPSNKIERMISTFNEKTYVTTLRNYIARLPKKMKKKMGLLNAPIKTNKRLQLGNTKNV